MCVILVVFDTIAVIVIALHYGGGKKDKKVKTNTINVPFHDNL